MDPYELVEAVRRALCRVTHHLDQAEAECRDAERALDAARASLDGTKKGDTKWNGCETG